LNEQETTSAAPEGKAFSTAIDRLRCVEAASTPGLPIGCYLADARKPRVCAHNCDPARPRREGDQRLKRLPGRELGPLLKPPSLNTKFRQLMATAQASMSACDTI